MMASGEKPPVCISIGNEDTAFNIAELNAKNKNVNLIFRKSISSSEICLRKTLMFKLI